MVITGYEENTPHLNPILKVVLIFPSKTCVYSNHHMYVPQGFNLVDLEGIPIHKYDGITRCYKKSLDVGKIPGRRKSRGSHTCKTYTPVDLQWDWDYARLEMGSLVWKVNTLNKYSPLQRTFASKTRF
jgi:hypothetical protein